MLPINEKSIEKTESIVDISKTMHVVTGKSHPLCVYIFTCRRTCKSALKVAVIVTLELD